MHDFLMYFSLDAILSTIDSHIRDININADINNSDFSRSV